MGQNIRCLYVILLLALVALVLSPAISHIARTELFTVHMIQCILLTTLFAPLLLTQWLSIHKQLALPRTVTLIVTHPILVSSVFNALFLLWHIPFIYRYTQSSNTLYTLAMLTIFFAAFYNWYPVLTKSRIGYFKNYPARILYIFIDGQPVDIFAFLAVFTGKVLYGGYTIPIFLTTSGFTPLVDQTIAGSLLLIPGIVDFIVITPLFFQWLNSIEEHTRNQDRISAHEMLPATKYNTSSEI